jgi:hypothetical protein
MSFPAVLLSSYSTFLTKLKIKSAHVSCLLPAFLSPHILKAYIDILMEKRVSVEGVCETKRCSEDATCSRKLVVVEQEVYKLPLFSCTLLSLFSKILKSILPPMTVCTEKSWLF